MELSQEVNCWSISLDIKPQPRPSCWLGTQSTEWLWGHLIIRQEDVEWLKAKRGCLAGNIQASQTEASEMEQLGLLQVNGMVTSPCYIYSIALLRMTSNLYFFITMTHVQGESWTNGILQKGQKLSMRSL